MYVTAKKKRGHQVEKEWGEAVRGPREWLQEGVMGGEGAKVRGEVI